MRRLRSSLLGASGKSNCYHVVSRVNGRGLVFGDVEKERFRVLLGAAVGVQRVGVSGLVCDGETIFTCCCGCRTRSLRWRGGRRRTSSARLEVLAEETFTRRLLGDVEMWRRNGCDHLVSEVAQRVRKRLFDLSFFMKELKQKFSMWFNLTHDHKGTLWEERFRSVLVEGKGGSAGDGAGRAAGGGGLHRPEPGARGAGGRPEGLPLVRLRGGGGGRQARARTGVAACVGVGKLATWRKVGAAYRVVLFGAGVANRAGQTPDGWEKGRLGFTQEQIEAVWRGGGKAVGRAGAALPGELFYGRRGAGRQRVPRGASPRGWPVARRCTSSKARSWPG